MSAMLHRYTRILDAVCEGVKVAGAWEEFERLRASLNKEIIALNMALGEDGALIHPIDEIDMFIIENALAKAIAMEREACAAIAARWGEGLAVGSSIAADIRRRRGQESG